MWECIRKTYPKARKDYHCDASGYVMDNEREIETPEDRELFATAKKEGFKILKGQEYVHIRGLWEGTWSTFRGRKDMCDIADMYDYWPEG